MPKSYKNVMLKMKVLEESQLTEIRFSPFFPVFSCIHIIAVMIVAVARSSKLIFINKKDFIEKEPAHVTLFDAKFFETI